MISSEIGTGTCYINQHEQTGLVVPPSDPVAFRQAMDHLWAHPERAQQMGRQAESRYWEYFTANRMAAGYNNLYRQLLEQHGRTAVEHLAAP